MKSCQYACTPGAKIKEEDVTLGTFNETFILMNVENIIRIIKSAFKERHFYTKVDLTHFINRIKTYSQLQINFALTQMINDKNEYISDYYGKYGNLINIGDYYLFQPIELNDKMISLFERSTPIPFKRDKITVKVSQSEKVKVGMLSERREKKEENTSREYESVKNIISSISYVYNLTINTSLTKKIKNDIADAQDPALKLISGAIPMISRDRIWYIYCNEMIHVIGRAIDLDEIHWYIFIHIMDRLTFNEMNSLIINLNHIEQISKKIKDEAGLKTKIAYEEAKYTADVYAPTCAKNILKYFSQFVTIIKEDKLSTGATGATGAYLFVPSKDVSASPASKDVSMYYKKNKTDEWNAFNQSELTSEERNNLTSKFKIDKTSFAQFLGFSQSVKDGVAFKIKENQNRGSVCSASPTKKRTLQDILQQYDFKQPIEIPQSLTQITYCILQEIILLYYNDIKLNDKRWNLNMVEAVYSV
jgi:hypothetical protein